MLKADVPPAPSANEERTADAAPPTTDSMPARVALANTEVVLAPRPGARLGRYELLVPIAAGGMAEVWVARKLGELGFRPLVALKVIRADLCGRSSYRRMFLDEARIASRIQHTNVVEVFDLGEDGPLVYQAMKLIEGDTVSGLAARAQERTTSGTLPVGVSVRIMVDALNGLHAAHELTAEDGTPLHLVHRDISPQNILVGVDGIAKIADFGIAKALGRLADETEAGQVKGKFAYMAPEQLTPGSADRRSDVFAAGIVFWEMLTGGRLFRGRDVFDTIAKVQSMDVPDPRTLAPGVPPGLAAIAMQALARDPRRRFETAAEMADALEETARTGGLTASGKDVAAFVAEMTRESVARRRAALREVDRLLAGRAGLSFSVTPALAPTVANARAEVKWSDPRRPLTRPRLVLAVLALSFAAAAIVLSSRWVTAPPKPLQQSAAAPPTAVAATIAEMAALPPEPTEPEAIHPAPAQPAARVTSLAPPPSTPVPRVPRNVSSTPAHAGVRGRTDAVNATPAPHVKFGNPYDS